MNEGCAAFVHRAIVNLLCALQDAWANYCDESFV
jgi:spore cortex formation protein SpoVR/YcgB (stage V sporulation)